MKRQLARDEARVPTRLTRGLLAKRIESKLRREAFPHVQMVLLVTLTGAAGLLGSFLMLTAGVDSMAIRYPFAVGLAYAVFLLLLWLWLRTNAEDYADVFSIDAPLPGGGGGSHPGFEPGGGGDFGGGGATGSFDGPAPLCSSSPASPARLATELNTAPTDGASAAGDAASGVASADELAFPLAALLLAIVLAFASLYVVYIAPVLFAELLIDGTLSYALWRRMRGVERRHWLATAIRRTWLAFVMTAVFLAATGAWMAHQAPGARSIGDFIHRR